MPSDLEWKLEDKEFAGTQKYWFPTEEDPTMGDLVWRVVDAMCGYWSAMPVSREEIETTKEKYGNVEIKEAAY